MERTNTAEKANPAVAAAIGKDMMKELAEAIIDKLEFSVGGGFSKRGHAGYDGNGMVGGAWGSRSCVVNAKADFKDEVTGLAVKADLTVSCSAVYDESTGYGSRCCPVLECDLTDGEVTVTDGNGQEVDCGDLLDEVTESDVFAERVENAACRN